jgi:hypothetical protein
MLMALATTSVVLCFLSWMLLIPVAVGLPLAVVTLTLVRRDLELMGAGRMDPAGRKQTERAGDRARVGVFLGVLDCMGCLCWPVVWLWLIRHS